MRPLGEVILIITLLPFNYPSNFVTAEPVKKVFVGIDIDASNLRAAFIRNGTVELLKNDQGSHRTPAYVAFTADGRMLIGDDAKCQTVVNPTGTAYSILSLLDSVNFDSEPVQRQIQRVPYAVLREMRNDSNDTVVTFQSDSFKKSLLPVEILALLLRRQRQLVEETLGEKVTSAVISVPSCLGYARLRAIRDAGRIAGFTDEVVVIEATVAAGVAYQFLTGARNKQILVINAGDASVGVGAVEFSSKGDVSMMAQSCSTEAGGGEIHQSLVEHLLNSIEKKLGKRFVKILHQDASAMEKLRREVERAIGTLSSRDEAQVEIESIYNDQDFNELITRSQFKTAIAAQLLRLQKLIKTVQNDPVIKGGKISQAVILGSVANIPEVRELSQSLISDSEVSSLDTDAGLWAVMGAAVQASYLMSGDSAPAVVTLCPGTFGYWTSNSGFVAMLEQGEPVVSTNSRAAFVQSTDREVTKFAVDVYEEYALDGKEKHFFIERVVTEITPTKKPDLWITFSMEKHNKLQVSVLEIQTDTEKFVELTNHLRPFRLQELARISKALFEQNFAHDQKPEASKDKQEL